MSISVELTYKPIVRYLDWNLDDPAGKPVDQVRPIRDDIEQRITALLAKLGVATRPAAE